MSKVTEFLRDVKTEMGRVNWPTKKQTVQYTVVVILMSLAVAAFLTAWDSIFGFILNKLLLR